MQPSEAVEEIIKAVEAVLAEGGLNQQQLTFVETVYKSAKALHPLALDLPEDESALRLVLPSIAQEWTSPLNPIRGYAEMLAEYPEQFGGELSPRQADAMRFVSRQAQALSHWYQAIADSAQQERQREYKASPQACDLSNILLNLEAVLRFSLRQKPIQLSLIVSENLPPIHAAAYHLSHLIEHIIKVMAFELVEYGKIQISAQQDGTLVNLRIFCTGLTSSSAEIESLFVKNGRHLYRQRFEQQGGHIEFSREAGLGAAVHLLISIAKN